MKLEKQTIVDFININIKRNHAVMRDFESPKNEILLATSRYEAYSELLDFINGIRPNESFHACGMLDDVEEENPVLTALRSIAKKYGKYSADEVGIIYDVGLLLLLDYGIPMYDDSKIEALCEFAKAIAND